MKMLVSEIFGIGIEDVSDEAQLTRRTKMCPFKNSPCTKDKKSDPLGICSFSDGRIAAAVCPVRFLEERRIFQDAANVAFGENSNYEIFPEIKILKIPNTKTHKEKKIGKVDYLIGKIENHLVTDFAAVEVQAVYFSGAEIRSFFNDYLLGETVDILNSKRGMDFRSSAQKRLVPQLQLKVPVFRRWGKKFFVVVDSVFFGELPEFSTTTEANSEVTWLSYPIKKVGLDYKLSDPSIIHSEWDEIKNSLREGEPPDPDEILQELQRKYENSLN
jgi:hypothetical protein